MEGDKFALNSCRLSSRSTSDRRKITITTNGIVLPDDLLIEILELLPVKSLLRFKCVSKWWYDLITSPRFTNNHLLKGGATSNTNKKMILLIQRHDHDTVFSFRDMDSPELEEIRPNLSIPFLKNFRTREEFSVLGSHNGIICFSRNKRHRTDIFLCNPALNQFKQLPPYPLDCRQHSDYSVIGLGFGVTRNNEFKVILIRQIFKPRLISARVYTSSTNRWKRIHSHLLTASEYAGHLFFNGACHWDCACDDDDRILSFDVNTEVFKHLDLPNGIRGDFVHCEDIDLIVLNGCLAFVRHQGRDYYTRDAEVWVMEEYGNTKSWNLKFRIGLDLLLSRLSISRIFLAWKNDECLLLGTLSGQLVSICLNDREITDFEIYGVPVGDGSLGSVIHEHSLVSLY